MASPTVDTSHGFTIVFGTSGFSAEITDITLPGMTREAINVSHQGTTNYEEYDPGDLVDNGELNFTIHVNPDTSPPITSAKETITITWPSTATWAFSGFMTAYEADAPHKEKMTASVTVKVDGQITIVAAS